MKPISARFLILSLVVATVCGCGKDPMNAGSVRGKVLVDNQPLTKGAVRFVPDKAKGNTAGTEPIGIIGEDGSYELAAYGKVGAPLGWYKVAVTATDPPDSSKPNAKMKSYVGKKFTDPETSGFSVEVVASPVAGAYDFKVSAK